MSGGPDRHRAAANGRTDLRRRLQKRAFAPIAQPAPPDTLTPRRSLIGQSVAPKHQSPRRATYQDVLDAPAHLVAEFINGTLHTHPRPVSRHALATSNLGDELVSPFGKCRGGPGGWWIIDEPEVHLDDEIVVPDFAGWRCERMPDYADSAYFTLAPHWVGEAFSARFARSTCTRNDQSTSVRASPTRGLSTPRTAPLMRSSSATPSGC